MYIKKILESGLKRRFHHIQDQISGNSECLDALSAAGYNISYHENGKFEENKKMLLIGSDENLDVVLKQYKGQMVALCLGALNVGLSMHCRAIHGNEEGTPSELSRLMKYDCLAEISGEVPVYKKDKRKKSQKITHIREFTAVSDARSSCTMGPYKLYLFKDGTLDIRTDELRIHDPEYLHVQIVRDGQDKYIFGGRGRFMTAHTCNVCSPLCVATRGFDMVA